MSRTFDRIECVPGVLGGKPVVKGTRLSIQFLLELVASGATIPEIAAEYDGLTEEDVREAILYAAEFMTARRHALIRAAGCDSAKRAS
jgi:uncharacterized protein (DUF433 family)